MGNETTLEERFEEKFKKLFIDGGISVLLDYPPHERVLDKGRTLDFIKQELQQERERIIELTMQVMRDSPIETQISLRVAKYGIALVNAINKDHGN